MRCAIYARYSSDMQRPESIDDQFRDCQKHIVIRWGVGADHTLSDKATTGTDDSRPGYLAVKELARSRQVDYVVVDDLSRLGRNTEEAISTFKELTALGVNLWAIADGIDTANRNAKLPFLFKSVMNEIFLDDLREKVCRGLRGQVERGYSAGGRVYGYDYTEVLDPTGAKDRLGRIKRLGVKISVNSEQAEVIRLIFQMKLKGLGLKAIAGELNKKRIPSPRFALRGTGEITWSVSSVRYVITQPKYVGDWGWNKTRWTKLPGTGKRVKLGRPRADWLDNRRDDLRIVSDSLWAEVQQQRATYKPKCGFQKGKLTGYQGPGNRGKYLFSGLLKCSECGGNLIAITSKKYSSYVCAKHWSRTDVACTNNVRVSRVLVEDMLLHSIRQRILNPEIITRLLKKLESRIEKAVRKPNANRTQKAEKAAQIEAEVTNLTQFILGGDTSEMIRRLLTDKESELRILRAELGASPNGSGNPLPKVSPDWIFNRVQALLALFDEYRQAVSIARMELRNILAEEIKMSPVGRGRKGHYVATVKGQPLNILKGTELSVIVGSATGIRTPV